MIENTEVLHGDKNKCIFGTSRKLADFVITYILTYEMVADSSKQSKDYWCTLASFVSKVVSKHNVDIWKVS